MMYSLTTYLLAKYGTTDYFCVSGDDMNDIVDVCKTNVGTPLEIYHKRGDVPVYEREFSNSLALVNPMGVAHIVNLGRSYYTLSGTRISTITVDVRTGVILLKNLG